MPRVKTQKQSPRSSRSSNKHEDNMVYQVASRHRCDHPGCSFGSVSRANLRIHKKIHTQTKDQICNWPCAERTDGVCPFSCTDPSSLNRHVKRHIKRAIGKGQTIPEEFLARRTPKKNPSSCPFNREPYPSRDIDSGPSESSSVPFASSSSVTHTPCVSTSPTDFGSDVDKVTFKIHESPNEIIPDTQSSSNVVDFCTDALSSSTWPPLQAIIYYDSQYICS